MKAKLLLLFMGLYSFMLFAQNTLSLDVGYQISSTDEGIRDGFSGGSYGGQVMKTIELSDGKLLVFGSFTKYNGKMAGGIARLLADGQIDPTFLHAAGIDYGFNRTIYDAFVQDDGKIIIVGDFNKYNFAAINNGICRLNEDGSLDPSFAASGVVGQFGADYSTHPNSSKITSIARLSDGNFVVGGTFNSFYNLTTEALSLAIIDGTTGAFIKGVTSTSATMNTTGGAPIVSSISIDASDNIYIGGNFHYISGTRNFKYVAKFNNQLVLDQDYTYDAVSEAPVSPDAAVLKVKVIDVDKLIIFGDFKKVNSGTLYENYNITRLNANGLVDPTFALRTQTFQHAGQNGSFVKDFHIDASGNITVLVASRANGNGGQVYTPVFYVLDANGTITSTNALSDIGVRQGLKFTKLASGKWLVGGDMTSIGTRTVGKIFRVAENISAVDFTFNQAKGFNGTVEVVVRDGNNTFVGGDFISYDGTIRSSVLKFDANGELVTTFLPSLNYSVTAMTKIHNGLLVAYNEGSKPVLAYLNTTTGAQLSGLNIIIGNGGIIKSMCYAEQGFAGGKLYIGGSFSSVGGKQYFMRANVTNTGSGQTMTTAIATDGSYLNTYYPKFSAPIETMKILSGSLYVGGGFNKINIDNIDQLYSGICKIVGLQGNGNVDGWMKSGGVFVGNGAGKVNDFEMGPYNMLIVVGKFTSAKPTGGSSTFSVNGIMSVQNDNATTISLANYVGKLGAADEVYKIKKLNDTIILLSLQSINGYGGNANYKSMTVINYGGQLNNTILNAINTEISNTVVRNFSDYSNTSKDIFAVGSFTNMFGQDRVRMARIIFGLKAPVAQPIQEFCSATTSTLVDIVSTQSAGVKYYTVPTGGTALPSSTVLIDETTYYLAASLNSEESVNRTPVTVNLVSSFERLDEIVACGTYTWINGTVYSASTNAGPYPSYVYGQSADGCDSIAYLKLTINSVAHKTVIDTVCGVTYSVAGSALEFTSTSTNAISTTNFYDTLVAVNGCDSIVTYKVTFKLPSSSETTITRCDAYEWMHNNLVYTETGIYRDTILNFVGCDSILTLNLTINESAQVVVNETACGSFTWIVGNETRYYTASTQDQIALQRIGTSCDSVIILNLTINQPTVGITEKTATECGSFTLPNSGGITYNTPGAYVDTLTLTNVAGCDSLVRWTVTILEVPTRSETVTNCGSYTWSVSGSTYTTSGTYTAQIPNQDPTICDSVITLNLTINAIPSDVISFSNGVLTATETGATYQWIDCTTETPIAGATSRTFTLTENGSYKVEITKNGCSATSDCELIDNLSVKSMEMEGLSIYPNPTSGVVTLSLPKVYSTTIEVTDVAGKLINTINANQQNTIELKLTGEAGMYHLKITTNEGVVMKKVTLL